MSKLRLKEIGRIETPPDKLRYKFPQDGHTIMEMDVDSWFRRIEQHYKDNGYPIPEDWKEIAEDQLCQSLPPGWCEYENGGDPQAFIDARMTMDDVINGTNVLIEFVSQGAPLVDQKLADSRARTCAACYANISAGGCAACKGLAYLVDAVAGTSKTVADDQLQGKSCGVCKCLSRAHVWLPIDVLSKGITPTMNLLWPDHCWKKLERA